MRTEEQIVSRTPIVVVLGGEEYSVKLLVIEDSRKWRGEVAKLLASIPQYANATTDDSVAFEKVMTAMVVGMPDTITDLFFQYAKDLNRDEIEGVATDAEMAKAFEEVVSIAFPLVGSMNMLAEKISGNVSQ